MKCVIAITLAPFAICNVRHVQQKYASIQGNVPGGNCDMDNAPKLQASKNLPSEINQRRLEMPLGSTPLEASAMMQS